MLFHLNIRSLTLEQMDLHLESKDKKENNTVLCIDAVS